MKRLLRWVGLVGLAAACSRPKANPIQGLPTGDGVWFEDIGGAGAEGVEETLIRGGLARVFLPAGRVTREGSRLEARILPAPARPFARVMTILVIEADRGFAEALGKDELVGALSDTVWRAVKESLRDTRRYGNVLGVHLDIPFTPSTAEGYGILASTVRGRLPRGTRLSISLRFAPSPEDREKMKSLISACDGFVAFLFGEGTTADPVAVDALEAQWWAAYAPAARGIWVDARGDTPAPLPEWVLARLSDDPRVEFLPNVSLQEASGQAFTFRPRVPVALGEEFSFSPGDRISFRQPLTSDLIDHLRTDLAGRRFARGRVVAIPGRTESERLFTLADLGDALAGKASAPDLRVAAEPGRDAVTLSVENTAAHASIVSRTSNWIEIQLPSGGIRDVQPGGFDRFELYGGDHRPITMALATTVRFYETLISPFEKIEPARILLRHAAPKGCCETRFHFVAASGQETLSDALTPSAPPPSPRP